MVVKIINTIVEISNSQMLKYAGHSEQRGLTSASFRDLVFSSIRLSRGEKRVSKSFLSNEKLLTSKSGKEAAAEIDKGL